MRAKDPFSVSPLLLLSLNIFFLKTSASSSSSVDCPFKQHLVIIFVAFGRRDFPQQVGESYGDLQFVDEELPTF